MSHQRTVYIVDADLPSRRLLTQHLARIGVEAWPFAAGAGFLEMLDHLMPACILLDIDNAAPSGIEFLGELGRLKPDWPVLAMSACPEVGIVVEAMKLGALDFLKKPLEPAALASALIPGFTRLNDALQASDTRRQAVERLARLSPRQLDIARALFGGQSNKGAAYALGISVRTVEMHRAHILTKLGVKTLAEAAVLATQAGVTPVNMRGPTREPAEPAAFAGRRLFARSA
ncbi:MAG: response regulator transcription factor [Allosphingosinicella sp.]